MLYEWVPTHNFVLPWNGGQNIIVCFYIVMFIVARSNVRIYPFIFLNFSLHTDVVHRQNIELYI